MAGRVFVLDPDLKGDIGHFPATNRALIRGASFPIEIVSHFRLPESTIFPGTNVHRFFPKGGRLKRFFFRLCGMDSFGRDAEWWAESCQRLILDVGLEHSDTIIVHSASSQFMIGLLQALDASRFEGQLHLRILYGEWLSRAEGHSFRDWVRKFSSNRIFLYAELDAVANEIRRNIPGYEVDILQLPIVREFGRAPRDANKKARILVNMGDLRKDKGSFRLPSIVSNIRKTGPVEEIEIVAHLGRVTGSDGRCVAEELRALDVKVIEGRLSDDELAALVSSADFIMLAYDPMKYQLRGSGVTLEAAAHGSPLIVPDGCALVEYVRFGNGLVATSNEEFATQVWRMHANLEFFRAQAAELAVILRTSLTESKLNERIAGHTKAQSREQLRF